MTNEEKAREIACVSNRICSKNCENEKFCGLNFGRECALEAMQWKDEQHAKEKQQWIDEACEWLARNDSYAIPTNVQVDRLREHLNNIK